MRSFSKTAMATVVAAAVFSTTVAMAFGYWQPVNSVTEFASTASEFAALQAKYPECFSGVDPATVMNASYVLQTFQWTGETTCPAGDPRLETLVYSCGLCARINTSSAPACTQSAISMPPLQDPCI